MNPGPPAPPKPSRALADRIGRSFLDRHPHLGADLAPPPDLRTAHPGLTEGQVWFKLALRRFRAYLGLNRVEFARRLEVPIPDRYRDRGLLGRQRDHRGVVRTVRRWESIDCPNLPSWRRVRLIEIGLEWWVERETLPAHWKVVEREPPEPWGISSASP